MNDSTSSTTFTEQLHAVWAEGRARRADADNALLDAELDRMIASQQVEHALKAGDPAPQFSLPGATEVPVSLEEMLTDGPAVLSFYRGSWCPYCNLELRTLQAALPDLQAKGARLAAISPQIPDESMSLTEKHELTFDVLSDIGAAVAEQFGIAFDVTPELADYFERQGHDLMTKNGGFGQRLVIPATYVIDRDGVIRWAFVKADYTLRAEPVEILAALDNLA